MKRFSTSNAISKMQIKTTTRYHYTLTGMIEIQNTDSINAGEDAEQQERSFIAGEDVTWHGHLGRQLEVSYKTKHTFTTRPNNHASCYLPKGVKNLYLHKNPHTMFIAILFVIPKL